MTQSRSERNRPIIEEFRANGGKVGGPYEAIPLLLLTTVGAKSGQQYIHPLAYLAEGERIFVFAANGGRPMHPGWYYNLLAHPDVTVEVGTERFAGKAVVLEGAERDYFYAKLASVNPNFAEFEKQLDRTIPVVEFVRS